MGFRFDEVYSESPGEVGGEEKTEGSTFGMRVAIITAKGEGEQGKKENFVKLGGMTGDSVAKIYSPGKVGGRTEGIVSKASKEAADATNGNANAERDDEKISGARVNVLELFCNFNRDPAAEKSTYDSLAARKEEVSPS